MTTAILIGAAIGLTLGVARIAWVIVDSELAIKRMDKLFKEDPEAFREQYRQKHG